MANQFVSQIANNAFSLLRGTQFNVLQSGVDLSRQVRYALINPLIPHSGQSISGKNLNVPTEFVFPVSPQSLQIQRNSLVNWYETQGQTGTNSNTALNVQRIVDLYGLTPMMFTLQGTTGYNRYWVDGFQKTGTQWMEVLQSMIETFFQQIQNNPTGVPHFLIYMDFWYQEYWYVVPVGPVKLHQSSDRPLWMFYDFTLLGINRLSQNTVVSKQNLDIMFQKSTLTSAIANLAINQAITSLVVGGFN